MDDVRNYSARLTKELLSWKIKNISSRKHFEVKKIPIYLLNPQNYKKKIEPLFLEEFITHLGQILNLNLVSDGVTRCKIIFKYIKKTRFFLEIKFLSNALKQFSSGDFVLFFRNQKKEKERKNFGFGLIFQKIFSAQKKILIQVNAETWKSNFQGEDEISIAILRKISNLKSILKEYKVLNNIKDIPLGIRSFLFSKSKINFYNNLQRGDFFQKTHLKKHFNYSQIKGIASSSLNTLTLIQGPPGTGKTRTILGIIYQISFDLYDLISTRFLNYLVYETKNKTFKKKKKNLDFFFNRENGKKFFHQFFLKIWIGQNVKLPFKTERIIVCAFSNAAIDENTARITSGLPMEKKMKIKNTFWILRLGPNYRYFLDHMTLDSLCLIWASENDDCLTVWNSPDILKRSKAFVLNQAKIIYTTLSCASYPFLEKFRGKETLLIDEAAQAIEISTITTFRGTCEKIILIGDVQQLPATVFSQSSADLYFERSLFKRLQQQNFPIHFLEMQYRMHPQISSFISRKFYNSGLKDATNVTKIQSYHFLRCFGPMIFFDNFESFDRNHHNIKNTWCNLEEIRTISLILRSLICLFSGFNLRSLGIIASYRGQILEIQEHGLIKKHHFKGQINTVDGFQGREKNVIFFSSVRVKYSGGIGFLSDCRRMNVAFTRAKFSFWGTGKASTLQRDYSWFEALVDFRRRGLFFSIKKPLERSNRRLIYWNEIDEKVFSEDGETFSLLDFFLIDYIKNITNRLS